MLACGHAYNTIFMQVKTGAAVIPFARRDGATWFLFHKTFKGRRAGLLVDFGGGSQPGESPVQTAAREFIEETDAMFFALDCNDDPAPLVESQYALMMNLIERTQDAHPEWQCRRGSMEHGRPRDWKTFFVEVDYRELVDINTAWAQDLAGRFSKRRELLWLEAEQLLDIIDNSPEYLWKRLRRYQGMRDNILAIAASASVNSGSNEDVSL